MAHGTFLPPTPQNEVIKDYRKGSPERKKLIETINRLKKSPVDIPMIIDGKEIFTDQKIRIKSPYDLKQNLGCFNYGDKSHVGNAVKAALKAKKDWEELSWEHRASIFLKMADIISGPMREEFNATTMLCQGKNIYQAEIDAVCELVDFLKFNVHFASQIYKEQPISGKGVWNRMDYRALEGFVFAITPFNFTSICANLCIAPALMGNTVVWKPADSQVYSAATIMKAFKLAGLPDGVINLVTTNGPDAGELIFNHPDFAGLHFTGSTKVFQNIWGKIGENISRFKSYPRIVGETGGKDFIMVHPSANPQEVATAISRGAFEFQGQKCSAASRAYVPKSLWTSIKKSVIKDMKSFKMGSPEDFSNFINCVIDEKSFDKINDYLEYVKTSPAGEILQGGVANKNNGYFIEPTLIQAKTPDFKTMKEEIFGPVITVYVYNDKEFEETLNLVDQTGNYALTGSIFSTDRYAIQLAMSKLKNAAGNFYINDKPTGAVVGQQPFGGSRGSGTNDKAGSYLNLLRWVSPRTIKETFVPPTDYKYPFLD